MTWCSKSCIWAASRLAKMRCMKLASIWPRRIRRRKDACEPVQRRWLAKKLLRVTVRARLQRRVRQLAALSTVQRRKFERQCTREFTTRLWLWPCGTRALCRLFVLLCHCSSKSSPLFQSQCHTSARESEQARRSHLSSVITRRSGACQVYRKCWIDIVSARFQDHHSPQSSWRRGGVRRFAHFPVLVGDQAHGHCGARAPNADCNVFYQRRRHCNGTHGQIQRLA